eukprot:CAMPEP_0201983232 /NCGR_PEP_ID=MMETSP0904-20121228/79623_1 /ASSEMBLY_ACC=CAM_ASM_000553 /TAXON_ID=420261 /ORGANISM="Thalassiosira antarctica, Strain CCMP982" /LENGTH=411 /DNA_ID=CAMNT_0048536297 /DNA_START=21 /DNA_END=1256 /DNA_ORIENTATION=+
MNEITAPTLRRLMENDRTLEEVRVSPNYNGDPGMDYYSMRPGIADIFPRGVAGWKMAGEIIGNNTSLSALMICGAGGGGMKNLEVFFSGAKRNNSICRLSFGPNVFGGAPFLLMVPLLENNCNLTMLSIRETRIGNDGIRLLASALSSCSDHRLESIALCNCSIEDGEPFEELVATLNLDIVAQPSRNSTLRTLDLHGNNIGRTGCAALAKMLSNPRCELKALHLTDNNIDDEGIASLADGLAKNEKLAWLDIAKENPITNHGWAALSKILCNTKTINDTFLSNHRLKNLGQGKHHTRVSGRIKLPKDLASHLKLNGKSSIDEKPFAPIQKILDNHHDWNMSQFIEEELQYLPYILCWIDRAIILSRNVDGNATTRKRNIGTLQSRRNLTIHQFVRTMPLIFVEKLLDNEI